MLNNLIKPKWMHTSLARQIFASFTCYLSVMTGSICSYWLSPYFIKLTSGENQILTRAQLSSLLSIDEIGGAVFSIPAALLADRYGRKITLLSVGPLSIAVFLFAIFTKNILSLYIVRILQGLCMATGDTVAPVYIAEISGAKRRGTLGGYYIVFWNLGILYAYINSDYLSFDMYTLTLMVLPILFCVTFIFMPESPYYYLMKNEPDKARASLKWLRNGEDFEVEHKEIEEAVQEDMNNMGSWKDLIATKKDRRALFIVQIVCVTRYLVGSATFVAYAEDVFTKLGQYMFTPNQLSICLALLFTLSSSVSSFFSDTVGRRKLLIYSLIGTVISNIIIAVYFCLLELTSLPVTPHVWIMYFGIIGYCIFTNLGLGQLMTTVRAEFFPSHTRTKGGAITNVVASFALFLQLYSFPVITAFIGMYLNFLIFTAISLIGAYLVIIYVPESARKTLAEVNQTVKDITSN